MTQKDKTKEELIEEIDLLRKRSYEMLARSEKQAFLGRLIPDIVHEVNNPLMIISGNAQVTLMSGSLNADVKKTLEVIMDQCQKAKEIMQRVLKFAQSGCGEVTETEITQSIEAVTGIMEKQFKSSDVEIIRDYPPTPHLVPADNHRMQEVFMHLLNNAKDAMPGGGTITITVSSDGVFLRIDLKDTGSGMPEEVKKMIFEPFFTTKKNGTGLGLPICYDIVKSHNGELKIESQLNKGTTATVFLPLGNTSRK